MLFLGMHAKVKLFIERDTQRSLQDIEDSKRQFKKSLDALETQKRREKLLFARAINTLKRLYQAESSHKSDYGAIIEKLQTQISMLSDIKESYETRITELRKAGAGSADVQAVKDS